MTPSVKLAEMIEQLPPDDRQHLEEYIAYLTSRTAYSATAEDKKYYDYIMEGIREGEAAYARGEALDMTEAKAYLESLLRGQ